MKIAAAVEYDGAQYFGWQAQPGAPNVQERVEHALSVVADHDVRVVCAGRTDTGVHALGQVIHFETSAERTARSWVLGANVNAPPDIGFIWASPVGDDFHARFRARSRRYRYVISNRWVRPALLRDKVCWERKPLDATLMQRAGRVLLGEHDFSSFRALACQAKNPVRTIHELEVSRQDDFVYIDVRANAFLHHMVRNIAGALMAIGTGERPVAWARELLAVRDRTRGGVTANAAGLYLVAVEYDPKYGVNLPERLPTLVP
ncbi:MAG: tRNA pseudouridine(38-40) synthase TruA [Gammaproteobacteria bacterium]